MNFNKIFLGLGFALLLGTTILSSQIFQTNNAGYVQVKQAAGTGTMSVRTEPGVYWQNFGTITEYRISDVYDFNDSSEAVTVRFSDASTADITGQIKYRLPVEENKIIQINQDFRSDEGLRHELIRQVVVSALKQTASMFSSEEVYSTRRSDFINLVNEQIKNGIYATTYTEGYVKDEDGNSYLTRRTQIQTDKDGHAIVSEPSAFKRYNIELVQLVVNNINFDEKTNELIAERKKADQQKVVAKANADKARQDALTAEAMGKAQVAQAEAEALVKKKTAVIAAEQEKEVAQQQALKAEEEKKAIVARGQADAEAARLKVQAGLTPLDRANIEKETAIGVARELANIKLPSTMVLGSGQGGQTIDPFTAVGLKSFIDISKSLSSEKGNQ